MPVDTFWSTQGKTPANAVLDPTLGDSKAIPYLQQVTSTTSAINPQAGIDDAVIFPRFDGVTNLVPDRPANFATPAPEDFANWHAYLQVEYLNEQGTTVTINDAGTNINLQYVRIGTDTDETRNLHAVLSQDGQRVIVLNNLQLADIAKLPLADQRALSGLAIFRTLVADRLGLEPNSTQTDATARRDALKSLLTGNETLIRDATSFVGVPDESGRTAFFQADLSRRTQYYHYLFIDQLAILSEKLDKMAIFSPDVIVAEAGEILERFQRLDRYRSVQQEVSASTVAGYENAKFAVNSLDELASIRQAGDLLVGVELRLYDLASASREISNEGSYQGRILDTPNMVFMLQTFNNYRNEAKAEALAEELNQYNKLLQDYTTFQKLLNLTLQAYDPVALADPDTNEELGLKGAGYPDTSSYNSFTDFSDNDQKVISMFDTTLSSGVSNTYHPIEASKTLTRPTENLMDSYTTFSTMRSYSKGTWDAMAVNISEATKIINQDTQLRMDEINKLNKAKNRHYELATSSLNKMAGILRAITS